MHGFRARENHKFGLHLMIEAVLDTMSEYHFEQDKDVINVHGM